MKKEPIVAMNRDAETFRKQLFQMMNRAEKMRLRELRRCKAKRLGPVEAIHMRLSGRVDGNLGMPRETSDHVWTSPLIQKEIDAEQEHRERVWGATQINLEPYHMRTESLLTVIASNERKLDEVKARLKPVDEGACSARKRGEEELTEEQIQARRSREFERLNNKVRAEAREIEQAIEAYYEELSLLHCFNTESENTAKLTCERVMDHTRQRIDAYWRSAMKVHPESKNMPVLPFLPRETVAEAAYMERHGKLNETVAFSLEQYRKKQETLNENDDEEAAA